MKTTKPQSPQPKRDEGPDVPVYDKPPAQRTPKEIKQAIEADAASERHGGYSR